ncbi:ABC transporter ATP-binding protein/permease [Rhizobium sp. YIM 134829]|uniref:ABC transporter ATP-binding protein/permease n=1 Tax=Rhizobium sp. YIM 134829 TaxID=3390453 RepID=UPI00397C94C6
MADEGAGSGATGASDAVLAEDRLKRETRRAARDGGALDLSLTYRLGVMMQAFWASKVRLKVLGLGSLLILIILATAYMTVILNEWNAPFFDAIQRRDLPEFFHQLEIFALIAGILLLLNVVQAWLNQMTALYMREGLTRDLVDQWLTRKRALRLSSRGLIGINPDQRLHEDARTLAESTTGLTLGLIQATILLVSFIGVLWDLSSGFVFHLSGHSFSIPGYMVWAAVLYAASASILSRIVGRKLVRINADRSSREAELRFSLMHASESMPAITVVGGEESERHRIGESITAVLQVMKRLALANTNLTWVSAGYGWAVVVVPIIVAAPAYFSGGLSFGQLMMSIGAFNQVNTALRWYVANFAAIAEWRATLMRVTDFRQTLTDMEEEFQPERAILYRQTEDTLTLDEVEIANAVDADPQLAGGFRFVETAVEIRPGERIMVNGDHHVNRKLLFQALAGLWPCGSGRIGLPRQDDMMFLPQTAYIPDGTLRDALAFPDPADSYAADDIAAVLDKAGLGHLVPKLDTRARWEKVLSAEEQKTIPIARLLLKRPRFAIFEEVFEGMEPDWKVKVTGLLTALPETAMIYIGRSDTYRKALSPRVLHLQALDPEGGPAGRDEAPPARPTTAFRIGAR